MGTITDKLNYLITTKELIRQAIINRGVNVDANAKFRDYAGAIDSISGYPLVGGPTLFTCYGNTSLVKMEYFDASTIKNTNLTTMGMFERCSNLTSVANLNLTSLTTAYNMFKDCVKLVNAPMLTFESVTNMSCMFYQCSLLETNVAYNASKCLSCERMFYRCYKYKSYTSMDTSKVTTMQRMFGYCNTLTDILNLDVSSVDSGNLANTFYSCTSLTRLTFTGTTIKASFDLTTTGLLRTGIVEMFNSLPTPTGTPSITLGATKLALLTADDKLIATNKGYVLL